MISPTALQSESKFEMYQTDYEPTDTGAVLTTGAIGKLATAAAETRTALAKIEAKSAAALADLSTRIERLERNPPVARRQA
jgi:hypothetical protein